MQAPTEDIPTIPYNLLLNVNDYLKYTIWGHEIHEKLTGKYFTSVERVNENVSKKR